MKQASIILVIIVLLAAFVVGQQQKKVVVPPQKQLLPTSVVTITPTIRVTRVANPDPILDLINRERAKRDLGKLVQVKELTEPAQKRVDAIYEVAQWTHEGFSQSLDEASLSGTFGENIARGYSDDERVLEDWINSPEHAENLFDPKYKYVGIARAGTGAIGTLGADTYVVLWLGDLQ